MVKPTQALGCPRVLAQVARRGEAGKQGQCCGILSFVHPEDVVECRRVLRYRAKGAKETDDPMGRAKWLPAVRRLPGRSPPHPTSRKYRLIEISRPRLPLAQARHVVAVPVCAFQRPPLASIKKERATKMQTPGPPSPAPKIIMSWPHEPPGHRRQSP